MEGAAKVLTFPGAGGVPTQAEFVPKQVGKHKEPQPNAAPAVHLSWAFYLFRYQKLGDRHYNPYSGKNIGICERIVKGPDCADGDFEEARRRGYNLCLWHRVNPDFWKVTPAKLEKHWADLHEPPAGAMSRREQRDVAADAEARRRREQW